MNILVITSVFRDESRKETDSSTNVVNLFVDEWKKQGHNVIVVHNSHKYPMFVYHLPNKIIQKAINYLGFQILKYEDIKKKIYKWKGIDIYRLPIPKYIPHQTPGKKAVKKQCQLIEKIMEEKNFHPDIIIGHWISPQAEIISQLRCKYVCKTALILHGTGYISSKTYNFKKYLKNIDILGSRSVSQSKKIKEVLDLGYEPFVCYSGVPDEFVDMRVPNFERYNQIKKWKFVFAGRLVDYKRVDVIIKTLSNFKNIEWNLDIIGEGPAKNELVELTKNLNCSNRINFHGKVNREEVIDIMAESHCFIMVSEKEVFGLVYLEAMASGCITVAATDGGVDGIILNNENGFLSREGDCEALEKTIKNIISLDQNERITIAKNGYKTACEFKDSNVAKRYLEKIINNRGNI